MESLCYGIFSVLVGEESSLTISCWMGFRFIKSSFLTMSLLFVFVIVGIKSCLAKVSSVERTFTIVVPLDGLSSSDHGE